MEEIAMRIALKIFFLWFQAARNLSRDLEWRNRLLRFYLPSIHYFSSSNNLIVNCNSFDVYTLSME